MKKKTRNIFIAAIMIYFMVKLVLHIPMTYHVESYGTILHLQESDSCMLAVNLSDQHYFSLSDSLTANASYELEGRRHDVELKYDKTVGDSIVCKAVVAGMDEDRKNTEPVQVLFNVELRRGYIYLVYDWIVENIMDKMG